MKECCRKKAKQIFKDIDSIEKEIKFLSKELVLDHEKYLELKEKIS